MLNIIDNKPMTVRVVLPQAWIARAFADWIEQHAEEFADKLLADDGAYVEWVSTTEAVENGEIAMRFRRIEDEPARSDDAEDRYRRQFG
jgi:hypothetical protein